MLIKINYSLDGRLENHIKYKKIIPYRLFPNERYIKDRWYYSYYYNNIFKIEEVRYNRNGSIDHAYIKTDDENFAYISTDIDADYDYAIYRDRRGICNMDIINNPESFTGAEIVYWFFMNNIDSTNLKYQEFWKFVDRYSLDRINDRCRYFIRGKLIGNKYLDCRVDRDTQTVDKAKRMEEKLHKLSSDKFMAELKNNDMKRMNERYKIEV